MTTQTVEQDAVPWRIRTGVKAERTVTLGSGLDGYSVYAQVRDNENGRLLADVTIDVTNEDEGEFTMTLGASDTDAIGTRGGVYDVLKVNDGDADDVEYLFGGDVTIIPVQTEVS